MNDGLHRGSHKKVTEQDGQYLSREFSKIVCMNMHVESSESMRTSKSPHHHKNNIGNKKHN